MWNRVSTIRIGGLNVELEELSSEVVGAQLGQEAVSTSLIAGAIGLALVCIFMCWVYTWLIWFTFSSSVMSARSSFNFCSGISSSSDILLHLCGVLSGFSQRVYGVGDAARGHVPFPA